MNNLIRFYLNLFSGSNTATRGGRRNRAEILEIVCTKPVEINSKKGTSGTVIDLLANYLRVQKDKNFSLQQYHVNFIPDIDIPIVRKALIREHKKTLGGYLYDGVSTVYLTKSLEKESTDFVGRLKDDSLVKITVKNTMNFIPSTDGRMMQLLNLILRRAMEGLNLQLVGRNYFDAAAAIELQEFNIQLWPGYITSIHQHEQEILMSCKTDHKVMRKETAYNVLKQCFANSRNPRDAFCKEMIGITVLTEYNNNTYRIDDVDWESSPKSTFLTKTGQVSYVDYYRKRYNISIRDDKQPILISKSKARDLRAGQSELIALIPELCRVTGLTDEMRKNYSTMNAIAQHTRLSPADQIGRIMTFNLRLQSNAVSADVFKEYNVTLSKDLVQLQGRTLAPEKVIFGNNQQAVMDQRSEWTHVFRNCKLFSPKCLNNWFLITPRMHEVKVRSFVCKMLDAAKGMGFMMSAPIV